jgi:DNA mismatch repair protein MutS
MESGVEHTPLMRQYWDLKSQDLAQGALLLFRMGDFYELFDQDAVEASQLLGITLTSRDKKNPIPMAGVPHHSAHHYIQRLLKAGRKVAIAEQVTPPGAKEIVVREIVRVLSPGIQFDAEGNQTPLLACLLKSDAKRKDTDLWTLSGLDVSTGFTFYSDALTLSEWQDRWASLNVGHCLVSERPECDLSPTLFEVAPIPLLADAGEILRKAYGIEGAHSFFENDEKKRSVESAKFDYFRDVKRF